MQQTKVELTRMAMASGFIVLLPKDRTTSFLECVEVGLPFAEPVAEFKHSRNVPLVCLIVDESKITHFGLGRRGKRAGTGLSRLNINRVEKFAESLSTHQIIDLLPTVFVASVRKHFEYGGLLTDKSFSEVVKVIRRLTSQASILLDRFSQTRIQRVERLSKGTKNNLAQQKEALLTALSISGLSRDPVQEWSPPDGTPVSFLEGLPSARLREDPMVIHDLMNLPGFDLIQTYPYNAAVFESKATLERLTVILANRLPLEEQTGTDLIYFNETYQSFVMIQYKAMEKNAKGQAQYRPSGDKNLTAELSRMDNLLATIQKCPPNTSHDGYRITENPFFMKLCSRIVFNPDDIGLVSGMYLPLDYWKLLVQSPSAKGSRGGHLVTFENAGRYFDNTSFTTIVSKAWIGTTPSQSVVLKEAILQTLETGKAVTIAVKPKKTDVAAVTNISETTHSE